MIEIKIGKSKITEKFVIKENEDIYIFGDSGGDIEIEVILSESGASVNLFGIIKGNDSQRYNIKTISNHLAPNTNSRVHIKGAFLANSFMDYNGMIMIAKKAQLSDAYLKNDNLLIGEGASVNSSPQLEIKADDVKASHGVTISSVDELQMHYLLSRGINVEDATNLLVNGFLKMPILKNA
ncbi:hypothetical protein CO178_02420 [candidate division WWE3 bacterium CG_4_9_14_3_um_filter_34_6]|uniref:SUF system FeS cluster assembly SufBD core domain-containing protein n=1 Tax=candidate division WWE3 bacterium CG_4_9_14_3_um_filter_34_6 TaxID=1975079 RepID=A0A2M7X298_UNCKA|nr:MAG: hypothetical protein CO178_02420 [candidate division WWE3 bacterium CG_4_9_14_3_um_filter_34_6]